MKGPAFPVGFEVMVNKYFGVVRSGDTDGATAGAPSDIRPRRIESMRLIADVDDEWIESTDAYERHVTYPQGWEYHLVSLTGNDWGWVTEAELIEKGYAPVTAQKDAVPA